MINKIQGEKALQKTFIVQLKYCNYFNQRTPFFKRSLESLIETTAETGCKIILLDNGEEDDEQYCLNLLHEKKIHAYTRLHNIGLEAFNIGFEIGLQLIENAQYAVFTGDDVLFKQGWLDECVGILEEHLNEKIIATPVHTPYHLRDKKFAAGHLQDGRLLNKRAGANCRVYRVADIQKLGKFKRRNPNELFFKNGVEYTDRFNKMGYLSALTRKPLATDLCRSKHAYPSPRGEHITKIIREMRLNPKTGLNISHDLQKVCGKTSASEISAYMLYKLENVVLDCTANPKHLRLTRQLYPGRFKCIDKKKIIGRYDFVFLDVSKECKESLKDLRAKLQSLEKQVNKGGLLICFMGLHRKKYLQKHIPKLGNFIKDGAFIYKRVAG